MTWWIFRNEGLRHARAVATSGCIRVVVVDGVVVNFVASDMDRVLSLSDGISEYPFSGPHDSHFAPGSEAYMSLVAQIVEIIDGA